MIILIIKIILVISGLSYMANAIEKLKKIENSKKEDILSKVKDVFEQKYNEKLKKVNDVFEKSKSIYSEEFLRRTVYLLFVFIFIVGMFLIFLAGAC